MVRSMKRKAKKILKKEEIAEDWCFFCKDGGSLRVCDYKQCLKAYHPACVDKDDSFMESRIRWTCNWHSCFHCRKSSYFSCYCCPKSVCKRCIDFSEFVHVRGKKVFCTLCLKIALLVEENKDVDSDDGGKVDFKDRETYEFLFMEYWALINEKEGLTAENLRSAKKRLKMGKNYISDADSDEHYTSEEENLPVSDSDVMNYYSEEEQKPKRKKSIGKSSPGTKKSKKSNKKEFSGWGSKPLLQFLSSIGKNPSEKLSQHDVTSIINRYINENNLFNPQKKKQIICDEKLKSVLGRKIVSKYKIFDLLETHFAENQDSSSDMDDCAYNSEEMDGNILVACKKQRKSNVDKVYSHKKDFALHVNQNCLASLVAENIKLIYLKRSLVKELLKQNETFENKVVGSYVRVKSDPNDFSQKNPYQLVQVTGIKKSSAGENDTEMFLQVSSMPKDISISALSDDDFSEEECEDLRLRVELGLVKKLTVNELEQKARILHEDQTKHWIARELIKLQNLIDRANEKGWRRELYEHMERKQLLNSSAEQLRLLEEFPEVIPNVEELSKNDAYEEISPKSILVGTSEIPFENFKGNGTLSAEQSRLLEEFPKDIPHVEELNKHDGFEEISPKSILVSTTDIPFGNFKCNGNLSEHNQHTKTNNKKQACSKLVTKENQKCPKPSNPAPKDSPMVINLSSDDEDENGDIGARATTGTQKLEDSESFEWYCLGPNGETNGPHSLSFLKKWSKTSTFTLKIKVWRTDQSKENAILLGDAVKN